MDTIKINISELKKIVAKLSLAVEKSTINPKSGWIEIEAITNSTMSIKVANYDYYLEAFIPIEVDESSNDNGALLHATVTAETFIPLVSKLDDEYVTVCEKLNTLTLTTQKSEYTFPIIKELGKVKSVDSINFNTDRSIKSKISGHNLASIADTNAKGLLNCVFSKEIQQFIYVDNIGALTFTENIYINNWSVPYENEFKFLINGTQARILKVFEEFGNDLNQIDIAIEENSDYDACNKVQISYDGIIKLVLITQSTQKLDKFPSIKLRNLASAVSETHAIIDKKEFEKALSRLMVFDKKFDITVLNYSKLVFEEDCVKLVSIKNKNYEIVPYISKTNTIEHESIIRFADIVSQLKAIQTKEIDISYGDSPAITLNSGNLKQLIPEIRAVERN